MQDKKRFRALAEQLRLPKMDLDLLRQAFCHTSWVREQGLPSVESNQRLEFLGDTVLDLCLAEHLYKKFPGLPEGQLTRMKSVVARSTTLARVARQRGFGDYLLLGHGEEETGGRQKTSLLADCVEAVIGAAYLAKGMRTARALVMRLFRDILANIEAQELVFDHKTVLQELLQKQTKQIPRYVTVAVMGPPHDRTFEVEVRFRGRVIGQGNGASKQQAQQAAAGDALSTKEVWLATVVNNHSTDTI